MHECGAELEERKRFAIRGLPNGSFLTPVIAKKKPVGNFDLKLFDFPRTPNFNVEEKLPKLILHRQAFILQGRTTPVRLYTSTLNLGVRGAREKQFRPTGFFFAITGTQEIGVYFKVSPTWTT